MKGDGSVSSPKPNAVSKHVRFAPSVASKPKETAVVGDDSALIFKVSHLLSSIFLLWLLVLHGLGIYFFATGFLLTRLILENTSSCSVLPDGSVSTIQDGCWHPKTFDRAVVVLIDALRYDFTVPFQPDEEHLLPSPYHNALDILYKTAVQQPEHAFLLPFIADPPTSTLQRLKGLTTGSLPTFIEIGSNFAGFEVAEDNIVAQLNKSGKTIVHLGDDTWHSLFPGFFDPNLTHSYDSFNVGDLHTVDNGVIEHIMPLLNNASLSNWDVVFAHFLGVDHAGHWYGPDHVAMTKKLQQMDTVLMDIIQSLDDRTLLVVMGDHGMDSKGDHGGESDDEVEAALWFYSRKPRFGRTDPAFRNPPMTAKERPVRQTDLVSTLSLLLGLPIPFGNLGAPIDEAFAGLGQPDWQNLATVNHLAVQQIELYQQEYSKVKDLEASPSQQQKHLALENALQQDGSQTWKDLYGACRDWHSVTLSMYRQLWANFEPTGMVHGIEILACSLISLVLLAQGLQIDVVNVMPTLLRLAGIGIGLGAATGPLLHLVIPQHFTAVMSILHGVSLGGIFGAAAALYQSRRSLQFPYPRSVVSWLGFIFTISQAAGFAANSYTIHEDTILLLFLTTFGGVACISSLRQASASDRVLGVYQSVLFVLLTRLASFSRVCREEQMPGCQSTYYASTGSSNTALLRLVIPYATALILPELIKAFYRGTASYEGSAGFWIGFCFRLGLLFSAVFWTVDAASTGGWLGERVSERTWDTTKVVLARCAFAIALPVGLATYVWAKPCINVFISDQTTSPDTTTANPAPTKKRLTILGYANVHGTRYFLLLPILTLLIAITLPPMGQLSIAICTWQILCLLEILDTNGFINASSSPSAIGPIVLAMLGSYHFFKTGHQATLSSIQWRSAFVGFRSLSYPWAPLLVLLNTFGPQILCAAAVPLCVLWKRPASAAKTGSKRQAGGVMGDVVKAMLIHLMYYATIQLATTLWAGHLRRHLMLYRVFMPRYLMATAVLVVVDVVLLVVGLMGVRVSVLSVGEVFGY